MVVFLRGCPLRCPHCHNRGLQAGESQVSLHQMASRIVYEVKGFGEMPSAGVRLRGPLFEAAAYPGPEDRDGARDGAADESADWAADEAENEATGRASERAAEQATEQISLDEASQRASGKPFVDALVLSGGEPLLQREACVRLFSLARSLHLETGIETSGCLPEELKGLLESGLLDRVFLDLKAPFSEPEYERATGRPGISACVRRSLELCFESGVTFEVRCTIFPEMPSSPELARIAGTLVSLMKEHPSSRLECLTLQQGHSREGERAFEPVSVQVLERMAEECRALCSGALKVRVHASIRMAARRNWGVHD